MQIKAVLITAGNKILFFRKFDEQVSDEPEHIWGFVAAISHFAEEIHQDQIKTISMGTSKIAFEQS